jgi:hypothetical protein
MLLLLCVCLTVTRPAAILLVTSFKGDMLSVSKFIGAAESYYESGADNSACPANANYAKSIANVNDGSNG